MSAALRAAEQEAWWDYYAYCWSCRHVPNWVGDGVSGTLWRLWRDLYDGRREKTVTFNRRENRIRNRGMIP